MTIYNVFLMTKEDGGFHSDCVYADDIRPELESLIRSLSDYKYGTDDKLVVLQSYDNKIPAPSVMLEQKWFHEVSVL